MNMMKELTSPWHVLNELSAVQDWNRVSKGSSPYSVPTSSLPMPAVPFFQVILISSCMSCVCRWSQPCVVTVTMTTSFQKRVFHSTPLHPSWFWRTLHPSLPGYSLSLGRSRVDVSCRAEHFISCIFSALPGFKMIITTLVHCVKSIGCTLQV